MKRRSNREGTLRKRGKRWYGIITLPDGARRERALGEGTKTDALDRLRRLAEAVRDGLHQAGIVRVRDGFTRLEQEYRTLGRRSRLAHRWSHLEPVFGADRVQDVTTDQLRAYVEHRRGQKAAPATIAREFACMRRILRLVQEDGIYLPKFPRFPRIEEDNVRRDFFDLEEIKALGDQLPEHLRPALTLGFWLGWRRGEVLTLQWRHLDLDAGTARLDPGSTKNRAGRYVHLPEPALADLRAWRERTTATERAIGAIVQHVIHRDGKPVRDFYAAWRSACVRAGIPGRRFHDLRRSAVRNYVRAGVSEGVAMKVTGHKTRSVFERYNIVTDTDLAVAAERVGVSIVEKSWTKKRGGK